MEITMNSNISIEMTLTKAHLLASVLKTAAWDVMNIDKEESELLKKFEKIISEQIDKITKEQFDEYLK